MNDMKYVPRPYVMKARAEAAADNRERVLASTRELLLTHSFDDITIEVIAAGAGTTARTVLRMFASKDQLFSEALHAIGEIGLAPVVPGDVDAMLSGTYDFYEKIGDAVIRWLADELRIPAMRERLNIGRQLLRTWVAEAFAPALKRRKGAARAKLHNALIVAFDVYTWKLLRRDFGLDQKAAQAVVRSIVIGLTRED